MAESSQSKNRRRGAAYERKIVDQIAPSCTFTARFGESKAEGPITGSTPDVMCLQGTKGPTKEKLRLIEAKINGYVPPEQRDELVQIAEELPEWAQLEIHYRPSPRKSKKRVIHKTGQDPERTREILEEEFDHKKLEEP